jgi:Bacterial Ig domain
MSRFQSHLAMLMVAAVVALTALNVKSVANSPPVGVNDNFAVVEGTQLVVDAPGLLVNDFDPDGDPIASGFHSDPAGGTILAMAQDGAFIYEPDPGFVGVDSFAYAVRDDLGSLTGRVVDATITVTAAPDPTSSGSVPSGPPVGVDDSFEVWENTTLDVAPPGVVTNDSDPDADPLSVALITPTSNGEISAEQAGSFRYTPDPGFTGVDSFRYAVEDGQGGSTGLVVDVVINVTPTAEPTNDQAVAAGAVADAGQASGVGPSPAPADPRVSMGMDSGASPAAWTSSSAALPATGTTSNVFVPVVLLATGLLVIAFGVRRAMNGADE